MSEDRHDDEIDFLEGVDPETIELGDDAIPVDARRLEEYAALERAQLERAERDGDGSGTSSESSPGFSFGKVAAAALAFALLGFGLGLVVKGRSDAPSAVDVGFARDMIDHHDQAVQMALLTIAKPDVSPIVRKFATEVVIFQRWEIGILDAYLSDWRELRGDLDRDAMRWMKTPSSVAEMPGMQTEAALQQLAEADGQDADRRFLNMMHAHHVGGVHMAEYAAKHASKAKIRTLAGTMARNQRSEIGEYSAEVAKLEPRARADTIAPDDDATDGSLHDAHP